MSTNPYCRTNPFDQDCIADAMLDQSKPARMVKPRVMRKSNNMPKGTLPRGQQSCDAFDSECVAKANAPAGPINPCGNFGMLVSDGAGHLVCMSGLVPNELGGKNPGTTKLKNPEDFRNFFPQPSTGFRNV